MKYLFWITIVTLALSLMSLSVFGQTPKKMITNSFDYDKAWREVDSLANINQFENVDKLVEKIYTQAKTNGDSDQLVKSINRKAEIMLSTKEEPIPLIKQMLEAELAKATFPNDAILHSILGGFYAAYANENYWKLSQVTPVSDTATLSDNIATWSLADLYKAAFREYGLSVANKKTYDIPTEKYKILLEGDRENTSLRPTLYDLLAHRALSFFMNEKSYLTQPALRFQINQSAAFGSVEDFVKMELKTVEAISWKYKTMVLFQDLLKAHQKDKSPEALINADLKRLRFVYDNATFSDKEDRFLDALAALRKTYKDHEAYSEISAYMGDIYRKKGNDFHPLTHPDNKWDWKYAFERYEEGIVKYPDAYGAKLCQSQQATLMQKTLTIGTENVLMADQNGLAWIKYRNVNHAYFKIVAATDKLKKIQDKDGNKAFIDEINKTENIHLSDFDLPSDGDLHEHMTEFKMPSLPSGEYYLIVSDNEYFYYDYQAVGHMLVKVSNLAYFSKRRKGGKNDFYVVHRETGQPQMNAKVEFYTSKYVPITRTYKDEKIGEGTTDNGGKVSLESGTDKYYWLKITKGDDVLELKDSYRDYANIEDKTRTTQSTQFFLDRKIYRPGQTVYFKAILLEKDYQEMPRILPNEEVVINFYDANGQEVATKTLISNDYGTVNGSFQAPSSGMTGQMRLSSSVGTYYGSSVYFQVEEYKRPKFEVTFNPVEGSYKLEDEITVSGVGKAFAGNNVDGAKVTYRVVRKVSYPYWRWWMWGYAPYGADVEITNGETTTNENGVFEIKFTATPDYTLDEAKSPLFTYEVTADVIDITGETHSSQTRVSVGAIALSADIAVPSSINQEDLKSFAITTANLNGTFEPAKGTISIYPLVTPNRVFRDRLWERPDVMILEKDDYINIFSGIPYGEENEYKNWERGKVVVSEVFDTDNNKALSFENMKTQNWQPGYYQVVLKTQDKYGQDIEVVKYFELFDLKQNKIPANKSDWSYFDNKNYEPNSTAALYYGTAYSRIFVLFEQYKNNGDLAKSEWVNMSNIKQINLPIQESDRGNIGVSYTFIHSNRGINHNQTINVPWSNKELNIEYQTFRDKLLPGQAEEWKIKISGSKKEKVAAEIAATMYDASLDEFAANSWGLNLFPTNSPYDETDFKANFSASYSSLLAVDWQPYFPHTSRTYPSLNLLDRLQEYRYGRMPLMAAAVRSSASRSSKGKMAKSDADGVPDLYMEESEEGTIQVVASENAMVQYSIDGGSEWATDSVANEPGENAAANGKKETDFSAVKVRTNLNETVFFYPNLETDKDGNVIISFTMNEALTRWKFLAMAHTKDLATAFSTKTVVTQKELMVVPNPPRFFRENDIIELTAKVSNLSDRDLTGSAKIELFDALTMQPIDAKLGVTQQELPFTAAKGQSAPLAWTLTLPDAGLSAITYRVIAVADNFSDGEENTKPVLTNRMLLTETMPMSVRGGQTKEFTFAAMAKASESKTLKQHEATLEFTSNPAWYAVQALPYLMEYPYECTEQIFSRYYANSLAASVTNAHPKIKTVFDEWKNKDLGALESNLSKNQELKYALLEETPWVFAAQNEAQQKKDIALLFDLNRMEKELDGAAKKIVDRQLANGGFAWFPGGSDSWYITQYLVEGFGHLKHLGVNKNLAEKPSIQQMDGVLKKAVQYVDDRMIDRYNDLEKYIKESKTAKWEDQHLSYMDIHYLYARSFYKGEAMSAKAQKVHDYFIGQAKTYWIKNSQYMQGLIALALFRNEDKTTANLIVEGLRQSALKNEEMGMYWNYNAGYYWYEMPIETHALMIEVFSEVAKDAKSVDDLKLWLLKNKQTSNWKTTKATASAVYALLMNGDNWLLEDQDIKITMGEKVLDQSKIAKEAGTGNFKVKWKGEEITADMANITIANPNKSPAWGAMYWQYFEDLDQVKTFKDTPLTIVKKLYKETNTVSGPVLEPITATSPINVGDKIKVRIELQVDRDMEYVHMKDMRASGFEPINVLSQYKWQAGLGYYESTKDAATNFFFSYLPKGTYVFEYPLRATFEGDFSNGVTTIQCMYAPEFTSHSEGIRVKIK